MARPRRVSGQGLRFQVISSLALVIVLLGALLAYAVVRISGAAIINEKRAAIRVAQTSAARNIISALRINAHPDIIRDMERSWFASGVIDGIWVMDGSGAILSSLATPALAGVTPAASFPPTEIYEDVKYSAAGPPPRGRRHFLTQFPGGTGVVVVVGTGAQKLEGSYEYLGSLLVIYLLLFGVAVLSFGYFAITSLIVRPIDRLRESAVRLGEGKFDIDPGREGAKEIQEVGRSLAAAARQLKEQRKELVEKIRQLDAAHGDLLRSQQATVRAQKLASVGRLTAGVAHEIGNPLTAIMGFIDLLGDDALPAETRKDFLARMQKETERVNRIIRDLLTFARAEGKEIARVKLDAVVRDACRIMAPQKLFKHVRLSIETGGDVPEVMASSDRLTQVAVNLLMNAAEAMAGDGEIVVRVARSADGKAAVLSVEDNGPGIPPEVADSIFEPFVTTKPEGQGTGLGLSVCHGIVTGFGGTIAAENVPPRGARFTVTLPAA